MGTFHGKFQMCNNIPVPNILWKCQNLIVIVIMRLYYCHNEIMKHSHCM